jgi:uncharacterized DUF497 family protein
MPFEWDAAKNAANIAKHGIDFQQAATIFEGLVFERADDRQDYGELRIQAFGLLDERVLTVVYTVRGTRHRIISARRAKKREREAYRQAFPGQSSR